MVKALADRLAEAFAEYAHLRARRDWYSPDEAPAVEDLHANGFAVSAPLSAIQRHRTDSLKEELFEMLGAGDFGLALTELFAMTPASSVSGLLFAHPDARYSHRRADRARPGGGLRQAARIVSSRWSTGWRPTCPTSPAAEVCSGAATSSRWACGMPAGSVVGVEQPGFEDFPRVQAKAVEAADQGGLVVDLDAVPVPLLTLSRRPALTDSRSPRGPPGRWCPRAVRPCARSRRGNPLPVRRPQPVPEQQDVSVLVPHDPDDAADELGVHRPQEAPLQRLAEPPEPGQQFVHGCIATSRAPHIVLDPQAPFRFKGFMYLLGMTADASPGWMVPRRGCGGCG